MKGFPPFEANASSFTAALEEAARDLSFVRTAAETRKVLPEVLAWERKQVFGRNLAIAKEFLSSGSGLDAIFRGIVVVVAGSYEDFVRQIVRSAVRELNGARLGFSGFPTKLLRNNRIKTAEAIRAFENPREHYHLDVDILCRNLGTCHNHSTQVTFNEEAFVFDITNVNEQRLEDIFEKLDLPFDWDHIGNNKALSEHLGTKNTRETASAAKDFVNDFIKRRNSVAHVGIGGVAITEGYVVDAIKFFERFGEAIMIVLGRELLKKIDRQKRTAASMTK